MIVRIVAQPPSLDDLDNWHHLDALDRSLDDVFWTQCGLYSLEGVESVRTGERLTGNRIRPLQLRQKTGAEEEFAGWRVRELELVAPVSGNGELWFSPVHEGQGRGLAQSRTTLHCVYVGWISVTSEAATGAGQLTVERLQTLLLTGKGGGEARATGTAYPWRIRVLPLPVAPARGTGRLLGEKKGHNWHERTSAASQWQRRA